jgi:hypothetical protein
LIAVLWILQGGRTIKKAGSCIGDSKYWVATWKEHEWQNRLGTLKPIDCRLQTLIWVIITVPLVLGFIATGATLNYFWDFTHNIPYYPWHFAAHFSLAYVLVTVWACFDIEDVFQVKYRLKALLLLGILNILSLYLENQENMMVLQSGLQASMFNNLPDSMFDLVAVLLGGLTALVAYNAVQYLE